MKRLIPLALIACTMSCSQLCKLDGDMEQLVVKANADFKESMTIENIPCEPTTINIILKSDLVDTSAIVKAHTVLFDRIKGIGWRRVDVYGPDHKYRFTHTVEGGIQVKSGD